MREKKDVPTAAPAWLWLLLIVGVLAVAGLWLWAS
jgi:hypothetical protein